MTSDAVGVASQGPTGIFPKVSHRGPTPHDSLQNSERHFREEWKRLVDEIAGRRRTVDADERLAGDTFTEAIDLAISHPDYVEVSNEPFDEMESDMVAHVRAHFRSMFVDDGAAPAFQMPTDSNFRTLIRACELVYVDDAVLRFAPTWTFDPVYDDLDSTTFTEVPDELGHWMERVQVMWDSLHGRVDLSRDETRGLIETLYGSRTEFVETAVEMDRFLPVPPPEYDEIAPSPNLAEQFARGHDVAAEDVHRYCYRRVLDEY